MTLYKEKLLSARNKLIIEKVVDRINREYPDIIDLIGITGSTHRGDNHPLSDLDLCIVVEEEYEGKFTSRFIIENICYDIYFTSWTRLEKNTKFQTPYVTKIMEMTIIYDKDDFKSRYYGIRKQLCANLNDYNNSEILENGKKFYNHAKSKYADLMISNTIAEAKYNFNLMMNQLELALYIFNRNYISSGLKDIPKEIQNFNKLPEKFISIYKDYYRKTELIDIRESATKIMRLFNVFITTFEHSFPSVVDAEQIALIYQELKTNWIHKLDIAIENNDLYSINMLYTFTQEIYNQISDEFNCERISLFDSVMIENLETYSQKYRESLSELLELTSGVEKYIQEYHTLEQFAKEY